jgi:hypothetical protein
MKELVMQKLEELAQAAIERHIGDVITEEATPLEMNEEAYTIAFDALADARVPHVTARPVARKVADEMFPVEE